MKKIALSLVAAILLVACVEQPEQFETKKIVGEKVFIDANDDSSFEVKIDVDFPSKGIPSNVLSTIQEVLRIDIFGEAYNNKNSDSIAENYIADSFDEYLIEKEGMSDIVDYVYRYQEFINGMVEFKNDHFLSYKWIQYRFAGGAHGLETTTFMTFDLANGTQITQSDVFVAGFETAVKQLLVKKLQEYFLARGSDVNNLWTDQITANDNFLITENGFKYWFNPYEIAPYSEGASCVTLSFEELNPWLRQDNASLTATIKQK